MKNKKQHLSENEARDLHEQALVIDTQQPPATSGFIFTEKMKLELNADKVLVQKSGYFSRSAPSSKEDLKIIFKTVDVAIESAVNDRSGVVGFDEDNNNKLDCINFNRIKGGKPFDINSDWYLEIMKQIGQIN